MAVVAVVAVAVVAVVALVVEDEEAAAVVLKLVLFGVVLARTSCASCGVSLRIAASFKLASSFRRTRICFVIMRGTLAEVEDTDGVVWWVVVVVVLVVVAGVCGGGLLFFGLASLSKAIISSLEDMPGFDGFGLRGGGGGGGGFLLVLRVRRVTFRSKLLICLSKGRVICCSDDDDTLKMENKILGSRVGKVQV